MTACTPANGPVRARPMELSKACPLPLGRVEDPIEARRLAMKPRARMVRVVEAIVLEVSRVTSTNKCAESRLRFRGHTLGSLATITGCATADADLSVLMGVANFASMRTAGLERLSLSS